MDYRGYKSLSIKLLAGVMAISFFLTILTASFQVLIDFNNDVRDFEEGFQVVETSYLPSLANAVWDIQTTQISLLLRAIVDIQGIEYAYVKGVDSDQPVTWGTPPTEHVQERQYTLEFSTNEKKHALGTLYVQGSLQRIYARLVEKIVFILGSQAVKTFVASFLILAFFNWLVTSRLSHITDYFKNFSPTSNVGGSLKSSLPKRFEKDSINLMADSIDSLASDLETLYRTLEDKIEERTHELWAKNKDIRSVFSNIHVGILTIGPDLSVQGEYSRALESIVEETDLLARPIEEILFRGSDVNREQVTTALNVLECAFGEHPLGFDINCHLLPKYIVKDFGEGIEKHLTIDWSTIEDEDSNVVKVLISITDVSDEVALKEQADRHESELNILESILSSGSTSFRKFASTTIDKMNASIEAMRSPTFDRKNQSTVLQSLHGIKGEARILGYGALSSAIHDIEETIKDLDASEDRREILEALVSKTQYTIEIVREYQKIFEAKVGKIDTDDGEPFPEEIASLNPHDDREMQQLSDYLVGLYHQKATTSMEGVLEPVVGDCQKQLEALGKGPCSFTIENPSDLRVRQPYVPLLRQVFAILYTNSIDHSIESKRERSRVGKDPESRVICVLSRHEKTVSITLSDDGVGLNLAALRDKSESSDELPTDDLKLAEMVFASGVSTKAEVTQLSGRGVGLAFVRSQLEDLGGSIKIVFDGPENESSYRPFHFEMTLDAQLFAPLLGMLAVRMQRHKSNLRSA